MTKTQIPQDDLQRPGDENDARGANPPAQTPSGQGGAGTPGGQSSPRGSSSAQGGVAKPGTSQADDPAAPNRTDLPGQDANATNPGTANGGRGLPDPEAVGEDG